MEVWAENEQAVARSRADTWPEIVANDTAYVHQPYPTSLRNRVADALDDAACVLDDALVRWARRLVRAVRGRQW